MKDCAPKLRRLMASVVILAAIAAGVPPSISAEMKVDAKPSGKLTDVSPVHPGLGSRDDIEAFLDEFFEARMSELHIPGAAIVVVQDGEVLLSKGYG